MVEGFTKELQTITPRPWFQRWAKRHVLSSFHGANQGVFEYESYHRCKGHDGSMTISYMFLFVAKLFMEVFHCREVSWWFISTISPWSLTICGEGNHPKNPGCRTGAGWAKPFTGEAVIERTLVEVATPWSSREKDKEQNSYETASPQVPKHLKYYPPFFLPGLPSVFISMESLGDLNEFHDKRLSEGSSVALA